MALAASTAMPSFANVESGPAKITRNEYIDSWKNVAIEEMEEHGIPASITLAQGILESGNGNSELARGANNHFGIKCHGWDGKGVYMDDDKVGECFRKYKNAQASFEDHSAFLTKRGRYSSLFDLKTTDYKGWAKGLRKAGYATNPKYATLLIDLIEINHLYQYDKKSKGSNTAPNPELANRPTLTEGNKHQVKLHINKISSLL